MLSRKRKSRGAHRAHGSRIFKAITEFLVDFDCVNEGEIIKLKGLKASFQQQYDQIKLIDEEIYGLIEEEDLEQEMMHSLEENEIFIKTLSKIDHCLSKSFSFPPELRPSIRSPDRSSSSGVVAVNSANVKLPKLELQNFNEKVLNWQSFWDRFDSAINSRLRLVTLTSLII